MFRFQSSAPKAPQHSHCKVRKSTRTHWKELPQLTRANDNTGVEWECDSSKPFPHIFLGEVYQVLQVNVVSVGPNVVVNEKVELVLDPVFEDEGQDSCSQLQEEDDTQEYGELKNSKRWQWRETPKQPKERQSLKFPHYQVTYKFQQERVFSQCADATGKSKDEHDSAHHQEEPDWVETPQVRDGGDVGEDALIKHKEKLNRTTEFYLECSSKTWADLTIVPLTWIQFDHYQSLFGVMSWIIWWKEHQNRWT